MSQAIKDCQKELPKTISSGDLLMDISEKAADIDTYVCRMTNLNSQSSDLFLRILKMINQTQKQLECQRRQLGDAVRHYTVSAGHIKEIAECEADIAVLEKKMADLKGFCYESISGTTVIASAVSDVSSTVKNQIAKAFDLAFSVQEI